MTCLTTIVVAYADSTQKVLTFQRTLLWEEQLYVLSRCVGARAAAPTGSVIIIRTSIYQLTAQETADTIRLAGSDHRIGPDVLEATKKIHGGC